MGSRRASRSQSASPSRRCCTLSVGIAIQAVLLSLYLALRQRAVLFAIMRAWKRSLFAGFAGAVFAFGQRTSAREALGMVLVIAGVALLMLAQ